MFQENKGQWIYCLYVSVFPLGGGGTECVGLPETCDPGFPSFIISK